MASTDTAVFRATLPVTPRTRRARRWYPLLILLLLALAAGLGVAVKNQWQESLDREPLRIVQRAASFTNQPIGIVGPELQDEWSSGNGPTEQVVKALVGPANAYLEPIFYAERNEDDRAHTSMSDRCYYLAFQPGEVFDPETVTGLGEICYLDPYRSPLSMRNVPIAR